MNYEVTIGLPVYNVEKYLRKTMESLFAQTFQSIEFMVCDDCGTDGSMAILEELQQTHPRGKDIHIVRQPQNMGTGAARNRIISEAHGRYLYWMDADDVITPGCIQLLYDTAQKYQAEIVYGSFERVFLYENNRVVQFPYPMKVFTEPDEYASYVYRNPIQVMHWNALIDIDILRRNNLKVAEVGSGYGEDFTFTVDLPTYITRAVLLPDITYSYLMEGMAEKLQQKRRIKKLSRKFMDNTLKSVEDKKRRSELSGKPYYAERCAVLMMYDYSFALEIVNKRNDPEPRYTNAEIRRFMRHPMSLWQILTAGHATAKNLYYGMFGVLPSWLSVALLKIIAKRRPV